ncbi:MAG: MgtC/SapB family protein [Desulfobulbaceae bacterium]|nr:MgtC/SapB family protein [Desulfobulbaceae bacterium]HIJ78553.1 MgtC/SapB family protein [Deltaproteobacteria bacterium]
MEHLLLSNINFWLNILVSVICGAVIGIERQIRGKPAGIRTSILICLGTEIFTGIGMGVSGGTTDHGRVIAQIITGIGFLGAGVIMSKEGLVRGVTSAAVIWVLAAIGVVIGLGLRETALALTTVTVCVLMGVEYMESTFRRLRQGVHALYHDEKDTLDDNDT